jgi:hypothetical protein
MHDTLLVWGNSFKIPVANADDPAQQAIQAEIRANICKTPMSLITLEGEIPQKATMSDTERVIANVTEKLKQRQARGQQQATQQQTRGTAGSDLGMRSAPSTAASTAAHTALNSREGTEGARNRRPSFQLTPPAAPVPTEQRDLAWFGGVHTDCNTILYKAPLQGWNTLLPTSFASNVATPARRKR